MTRVKVALDANIPPRMARMLQTGFGDHGFEFLHETSFASGSAADEFWATAFRRFGGKVVLTGDKNIARRPHQILAFQENDLICFFCERRWSEQDLAFKVAHLMYWWPMIEGNLASSKPRDCWWVPMPIKPAEFRRAEVPKDVLAKAKQGKSA